MDLEQRVHASYAAPDPGAEFTAAVMARVGQRSSRWRRSGSGTGGGGRRRNRFIVIGVVAVGVAAAMLALWLSGAWRQPVVTAVAVSAPLPNERTVLRVEAPVEVSPAPLPEIAGVAQSASAAVVPSLPLPQPPQASARYTVVATLRQDATDPDACAAVAIFFAHVLDELRKVPGLTLRVWDAADPAPPVEGEYGLTIASLATTTSSTGLTSYRTSIGQGSFSVSALGTPWPLEWRVDRGGPPTRMSSLFATSLLLAREGVVRPALCSRPAVPTTGSGTLCMTGPELAANEVERLRAQYFPVDSSVLQLFAARVTDRALTERQRTLALNSLLAATRRKDSPQLDSGSAAAIVRLVADLPSTRETVWRLVRNTAHPELVPPLLASMEKSVDEGTRQEALNALVTGYAGDPRVRAGLRAVASDDPSEFLRALARYPETGVDGWLAYIRQAVKNERLTIEQRLKPLVYTSDEAQGDFRKAGLAAMARDAEIADAVLAITLANPTQSSADMATIGQVGAIRRALYALTVSEGGPIEPGSRRQELQALYNERSGGSFIGDTIENLRRGAQEPAGATALPK